MAVRYEKIQGDDIPVGLRGPMVKEVWAVYINDGLLKYCSSEKEALSEVAVAERAEEARRPKFDTSYDSGPS